MSSKNKKVSTIQIGSRVQLEIDGVSRDFRIVETPPLQKDPSVISAGSQIGSALMGKEIGDTLEIIIEGKTHVYKVVQIQ